MLAQIRAWVRERRLTVICSLGLAAISCALFINIWVEERSESLRMSAGPMGTRRHAIAAYLSRLASNDKYSISLVPNAGSEECLKRVQSGELDAAIVSNGVVVPNHENLKVIATLQLEAVHILVRKSLITGSQLREMIRGKRVNIGVSGSTEKLLAKEFLNFSHLRMPSQSDPGDIIPVEMSKDELLRICEDIKKSQEPQKNTLIRQLPDCLIILASMPSTLVQNLVEADHYVIFPLPASKAFLSDNLQDAQPRDTVVQREFLELTSIPARSYVNSRMQPETDAETIGVRLLVVSRKDLAPRKIRPLLHAIYESEFTHRMRPVSPRDVVSPYGIHSASIAYLDRGKPFAMRDLMEWFNKGLSLLGAFSAGALSLYGLLRGKKIRKPVDYFTEIRLLDQIALGKHKDDEIPETAIERTRYLNTRLILLRDELIADICAGRIKGDQVVFNILTLLQEARKSIPNVDNPQQTSGPESREQKKSPRSKAA